LKFAKILTVKISDSNVFLSLKYSPIYLLLALSNCLTFGF